MLELFEQNFHEETAMVENIPIADFIIGQELYCIIAGASVLVIITDRQLRKLSWAYVVQTRIGITYEAWAISSIEDIFPADLYLVTEIPIGKDDLNISLPDGKYKSRINNRPTLHY